MDSETTERIAALFGALGNPTRVLIVREIAQEPLRVTTIAERLNIAQSSASQHLAILERSGLIKATRMGTSRLYGIRGPRVAKLLETVAEFCEIHGLRGLPEALPRQND